MWKKTVYIQLAWLAIGERIDFGTRIHRLVICVGPHLCNGYVHVTPASVSIFFLSLIPSFPLESFR